MFALGLHKDQWPAGYVEMAFGGFLRPVFPHLRRGCDGIGAGGIGGLALTHNDRGIAIHRHPRAGVLEGLWFIFFEHGQ